MRILMMERYGRRCLPPMQMIDRLHDRRFRIVIQSRSGFVQDKHFRILKQIKFAWDMYKKYEEAVSYLFFGFLAFVVNMAAYLTFFFLKH